MSVKVRKPYKEQMQEIFDNAAEQIKRDAVPTFCVDGEKVCEATVTIHIALNSLPTITYIKESHIDPPVAIIEEVERRST